MGKPSAALRAAGWVTVGAIAAGGIATAATTGGSSGSNPSSVNPAAAVAGTSPAKAAGKPGHAGRLAKLQGRLMHGEFTVKGKGGTPTNLAEQRGTVNAVSSTSITLTSTDGFKHTYVVDSNTHVRVDGAKGSITGVKPDQVATVLAKVSGNTETATIVIQRAGK